MEISERTAFVSDLKLEQRVDLEFIVTDATASPTRNGTQMARMTLSDRSGRCPAVLFGCTSTYLNALLAKLAVQPVAQVTGRVSQYGGEIQIEIDGINVKAEPDCYADLMKVSPRGLPDMIRELNEAVANIRNPELSLLLSQLLIDHGYGIADRFQSWPAAKARHHAYLHGLLEHSLEVHAFVCADIAHFTNQGWFIQSDLLRASALLHDIGKVGELELKGFTYDYSVLGNQISHMIQGCLILQGHISRNNQCYSADFSVIRDLLLHQIASHHGERAYGADTLPNSIEASLLHQADRKSAELYYFREGIAAARPDEVFTRVFNLDKRMVFTRMKDSAL